MRKSRIGKKTSFKKIRVKCKIRSIAFKMCSIRSNFFHINAKICSSSIILLWGCGSRYHKFDNKFFCMSTMRAQNYCCVKLHLMQFSNNWLCKISSIYCFWNKQRKRDKRRQQAERRGAKFATIQQKVRLNGMNEYNWIYISRSSKQMSCEQKRKI